MKPRARILLILVAVLLIIVLTVGGLLFYNLRRMIPQYDGLAYAAGLDDTVDVLRDAWGVPHIYASTAHDLFFAQGYIHAQDRWWQMEFNRHVGLGSIERLTGFNTGALGNDLAIRTMGWHRAAQADLDALDDDTRAILEAYAAGINAYLSERQGGDLALEYTLLGLTGIDIAVEPWSPVHSLGWAKVMSWNLSGNRSLELTRMRLCEEQFNGCDAAGQDMLDYYLPAYPFDERPTIVTTDDLPLTADTLAAAPVFPPGVDYAALAVSTAWAGGDAPDITLGLGSGTGIGSNNWVVSGEHAASGQPLLANDPHLSVHLPSIWYENGLHCREVNEDCPFDVVGFSFSGVPAVIIGHNQRIAWGVTNVGPDTQDLYILRINPENPLQYEYNGEWRDMEVVTEVIPLGSPASVTDDPATEACEGISGLPINDDGDLEIQVRLTHFGPITSDNTIEDCAFIAQENDSPLALRWTALEPGDLAGAFVGVNLAQDWASFREALRGYPWPSQNFVYADVDGNIGYQTPGVIPVRAGDHSGLVPVPGWTDEYEWRGYIPFDALPRIYNPERGWIVTANHAVVPPAYYEQLAAALGDEFGEDANFYLSQEWAIGYRAERIIEMINATDAHTPDSFAEIQGDNHNMNAEMLIPALLDLEIEEATLADAVTWLAGWDLQNHMDSAQAALFESFWAALLNELWADQLGNVPGGGGNVMQGTRLLLNVPDHAWWDDINTPDVVETRDDILLRALASAYDYMVAQQGDDRSAWRWGDLHTVTFVSDPLGQSGIGFVENLVNAGPYPTSGGSGIVNATSWNAANSFGVASLPSLRLIVDLSDLENSRAMHTTGQSGHPLGPHYTDMIDAWRFIQYHPMLFGAAAVEDAATNRLELRP